MIGNRAPETVPLTVLLVLEGDIIFALMTILVNTILGAFRSSSYIQYKQIQKCDFRIAQMTVFDNLMMGVYLPSAHLQAEKKIKEVCALLPRLEERQMQMASTLSGGERRMLAIGRGLMPNGRILLIDEPS